MHDLFTRRFSNSLLRTLIRKFNGNFVPKHEPVKEDDVKILEGFIFNSDKLVILTGAGISTESGIPDYRSEGVGLYARSDRRPIQYVDFLKSAATRQRYWARNYVGWERFSSSQPNANHLSIRNLELEHGKVTKLITQNVDNLHYKAGSQNVIELHGTGFRVICLECKATFTRFYIQEKIMEMNPDIIKETSTTIRPDGDVEIAQDKVMNFRPPLCEHCGGILKPDIVFFGENVPKPRVELIREAVSDCDSLLVLGSSLSVFSGYRIVLQALDEGKNVAIVNIGPTRADKHDVIKISARCGDILPRIC